MKLYRRRVWTCKVSGKMNLTYEEALVSERKATEKVQQFPKEFMGPVLRMVQFSMFLPPNPRPPPCCGSETCQICKTGFTFSRHPPLSNIFLDISKRDLFDVSAHVVYFELILIYLFIYLPIYLHMNSHHDPHMRDSHEPATR